MVPKPPESKFSYFFFQFRRLLHRTRNEKQHEQLKLSLFSGQVTFSERKHYITEKKQKLALQLELLRVFKNQQHIMHFDEVEFLFFRTLGRVVDQYVSMFVSFYISKVLNIFTLLA